MKALVWTFHQDAWPFPIPFLWDALGSLPTLLDPDDSRDAIAQIADKNPGSWDAMSGFSLIDGVALKYPNDPLMYPIAHTVINGDTVFVYQYSWVCVRRADRSFEVARIT